MDVKFENRYFCEKKALTEFARKYSIGPTPKTMLLTIPLVILCLPVLILGGVDDGRDWILWAAMLILISVQFLPNFYAWSVLRNSKKQNDGILPETQVVFTEENIQMFEGMIHLTIEYRKIEKAVRLNHSYALFNGKRTAVLIQPDGFTVGSFDAFKAFLREKCPGIKIDE